jgi:hypothetical protein
MAHPDFRVKGKIFATLGYPKAGWGTVMLTPQDQSAFVQLAPEVFMAVPNKWGEQGATNVALRKARTAQVRDALRAAHETRQRRKRTLTKGR